MAKIPEIRPKQSIFGTVREMLGRVEKESFWNKVSAVCNIFTIKDTIDFSKVNYTLSKALYYASEIEDRNGKKWGANFIMGAVFAKPIVNAAASFILGSPIQVDSEDEYTKEAINDWLKQNHSYFQQAIRNSLRDGDEYMLIDNNTNVRLLGAENVDKEVDALDLEKVNSYKVTYYYEDDENSSITKKKYELKYSTLGIEVTVYKQSATKGIVDKDMSTEYDEERPIAIIHFSNEKEPNAIYGQSEYQSCYILMANYHEVMKKSIKNTIYNSAPVPYITGIENISKFLETNGERQDDGTYKINWNTAKLMLGTKDTKFGVIQSPDTVASADKLLNLLFWGICQTSETPEFIMGTAVQSSKASTESQMPIMVEKAKRKQGLYKKPIKEAVNLFLYVASKLDPKIKADLEYSLVMPEVAQADEQITLEKAKLLAQEKAITKETLARMLGLEEYVDDVQAEVDKANKETEASLERESSLIAPYINNRPEEEVSEE